MQELRPRLNTRSTFTAALLASILGLTLARCQAEPPEGSIGGPDREFAASRAETRLRRLMAGGLPHPIGYSENHRVRDEIEAQLRELGLRPERQVEFVCGALRRYCGQVENVLVRLPAIPSSAAEPTAAAGLLNTHYDTVPAAPGASDSMAGVAALLEIAAMLRDEPSRNDLILLFNDGEEAGLLGATAFVELHPWARQVRAVVALDARGSAGASYLAFSEGKDWPLVRAYASAAHPAGNSALTTLAQLLPNSTDLGVFSRLSVPGVLFGYAGNFRNYHSATDTLDRLDRGSFQQHGENALALARELRKADFAAWPAERGLFTSLGLSWVAVPLPWGVAFAGFALFCWVFRAVACLRRRLVAPKQFVASLAFFLASLVLAVLLGALVEKLRRALTGSPTPWVSTPLPGALAAWTAGALAILGSTALALRRLSPAAIWLGIWAGWALLGFALALRAGSVSYLAAVPLLLAAAVPMAHTAEGGKRLPWPAAALAAAPALSAALLWGAVLWPAIDLLGLGVAPVASLAVAFALSAAAALMPRPAPRWPVLATLVVAVALLSWAARTPVFSERLPQFGNLLYVLEPAEKKASWLYTGAPLPQGLREAASFTQQGGLPWSLAEQGEMAPAPYLDLAPPRLEAIQVVPLGSGKRLLHARLSSPRGAPVLELAFPRELDLASLTLGGVPVPKDQSRFAIHDERFQVVTLWTLPVEGIDLTLELPGRPVDLLLADRTFTLPPSAGPLVSARPPWAAPNQMGDGIVVFTRTSM